jgi:hypothetical protein
MANSIAFQLSSQCIVRVSPLQAIPRKARAFPLSERFVCTAHFRYLNFRARQIGAAFSLHPYFFISLLYSCLSAAIGSILVARRAGT